VALTLFNIIFTFTTKYAGDNQSESKQLSQQENQKLVGEHEIVNKVEVNRKIDWNDYDFINYEKTRTGPGENGEEVIVTDPEEIKKNEYWEKMEGFYVEVSNKLSLTRALPDHVPKV
jgi:hypothetical protein